MSVLAAVAGAIIVFRIIGYANKYQKRWPMPEWLIDFGPIAAAALIAWDQWYLAVAVSFFAVMLLSIMDVGRDVLMVQYVSIVQGRRR